MSSFLDNDGCTLIGMVHLLPLPGSPRWGGSINEVMDRALLDAERLLRGGCDALIVENMGDVPYLRGRIEPETVAAMSVATQLVARIGAPTGVQALAGANREALGIAVATGAVFIRAEAFAYAHVADEGWMDACAGELLRTRKAIDAEIDIWADVQKKHAAHAVTADIPLADLAKGTAFVGADALVITGSATGEPTSPEDIKTARAAERPVLVGSGVTTENAKALAEIADGLIVGSSLKEEGDWEKPVDLDRVKQIKSAMR